MWVHNTDSLKFIAMNDAALAHYGYSEEAIRTMRLPDIVPKEDDWDALEALIREGGKG